MNYTKEIVEQAIEKALQAKQKFINEWIEQYGAGDFGTCGFAIVEGLSGRKRTLCKILEELGYLSSGISKGHSIRIPYSGIEVCTQNIEYFEQCADVICKSLNKELELDLYVYSWVD